MKAYIQRNRQRALAITMIIVIIFLNIFGVRFGFDLILVTFGIFTLFRGESSTFVKDWWKPIVLFFTYEFLRGRAYRWGHALFGFEPIYQGLITFEEKVFFFMDQIPPVFLQQTLRPDISVIHWYDYVLFFFYTSFFWYWLAIAFAIWMKRRHLFNKYMYGLVGFSIFSCFIFFFLPSAPPWAASQNGLIEPLERILWTSQYLPSQGLNIVSTYGQNDFAAMPSHHAAWPFFATLFLIKAFGKKFIPFMLVPLTIAFATWYGAEHYVVDSLVGFAIATSAFLIVTKTNLFEYKTVTPKSN
ncbi:phosphatase PAP2 family protein [Candidatus Dojkabacteria bacterium]|uniref:Phosphatase PAP2 family protein n=1 Tax=Candidatus Dojkabacteria bacterium TaxID=2099670 RepID=A0A955L6T8_9BACT|nr:phosphatase PAP2 family protein [Candidatus Dojkabacteria bacterium]